MAELRCAVTATETGVKAGDDGDDEDEADELDDEILASRALPTFNIPDDDADVGDVAEFDAVGVDAADVFVAPISR